MQPVVSKKTTVLKGNALRKVVYHMAGSLSEIWIGSDLGGLVVGLISGNSFRVTV